MTFVDGGIDVGCSEMRRGYGHIVDCSGGDGGRRHRRRCRRPLDRFTNP